MAQGSYKSYFLIYERDIKDTFLFWKGMGDISLIESDVRDISQFERGVRDLLVEERPTIYHSTSE